LTRENKMSLLFFNSVFKWAMSASHSPLNAGIHAHCAKFVVMLSSLQVSLPNMSITFLGPTAAPTLHPVHDHDFDAVIKMTVLSLIFGNAAMEGRTGMSYVM